MFLANPLSLRERAGESEARGRGVIQAGLLPEGEGNLFLIGE